MRLAWSVGSCLQLLHGATDPAAYTANHILAVRSLILEGSAIGLQGGACPVAVMRPIRRVDVFSSSAYLTFIY